MTADPPSAPSDAPDRDALLEAARDAETSTERRAVWTTALRSGRWEQGFERLRTATGYCCLGVVEDLRGAPWRDDDAHHRDEPHHEPSWYVDDGMNEASSLSAEGRRWLGLENGDPVVAYRTDAGHWTTAGMITLNDTYRFTFPRLADVVDDQDPDWDGSYRSARATADRRNERDGTYDPTGDELL